MIFLIVGTQFPFDRLVKTVDDAVEHNGLCDRIVAQIGQSSYVPRNMVYYKSIDKEEFDSYCRQASCIISHAGIGSITMALEYDKPLLVMPRRKKYGEVVNDHQVAIAKRFEALNHLLVAYDEHDIPKMMVYLKSFVPQQRQVQTQAVVTRIKQFLAEVGAL